MTKKPIVGIACSIFVEEIKQLIASGELDIPFIYLNSTLHMHPDKLQDKLSLLIDDALEKYEKIVLVYGDCHPFINDAYDTTRVVRVRGINCCEIMLGTDVYRILRHEGLFFVFKEWAYKWKQIFVDEIGLTETTAPFFMNDMHTGILYLDTGTSPVPHDILKEMSSYFQLNYSVETISLDYLKKAILQALVEDVIE